MAVSVRTADAADLEVIADIHVRGRRAAYRGLIQDQFLDGDIAAGAVAARWDAIFEAKGAPVVFVAELDGRVVGFMRVATPSHDEDTGGQFAEILTLYIDPAVWRSGAGKALMHEALAFFRDDGWEFASLWMLAGNAQAQAFYTTFGFTLDGAEKVDEWHGGTELRMRLPLTAA